MRSGAIRSADMAPRLPAENELASTTSGAKVPRARRAGLGLALFAGTVLSAGSFGGAFDGVAAAAGPNPRPAEQVVTRSLPAESGVRSEAETVLAASPERIIALLSEPRNYIPLFPATSIQVVGALPAGKVIEVEMKKPWPVGTVRWTEDVVIQKDPDGHSFTVERTAHPGYFRRMIARWRITPAPGASAAEPRSLVTYEVAMELARWAPDWAVRRGNLAGIRDTMAQLRKLVDDTGAAAPKPAPAPEPAAAPHADPAHEAASQNAHGPS